MIPVHHRPSSSSQNQWRRIAPFWAALPLLLSCSSLEFWTPDSDPAPVANPDEEVTAVAHEYGSESDPIWTPVIAPNGISDPEPKEIAEAPEELFSPPDPKVVAGDDDPVTMEQKRLDLLAQKTEILVANYVSNAQSLEERFDFVGAEAELLKAQDLAPTNRSVADHLARVQSVLGRSEKQILPLTQSATERYAAKNQQRRVQAMQDLADARKAITTEDYNLAVILARTVISTIEATPEINWDDVTEDAHRTLALAEHGRSDLAESTRAQREAEAYRRLQEESRRNADQEQAKIEALIETSTERFLANDYLKAEELARAVLDLDPHHPQAFEILDASRDASRGYLKNRALQKRREQFQIWRESMEEVRVPYSAILTAPDPEQWDNITRLRGGDKSLGLPEIPPEETTLRARLQTSRMDADFDDLTITQVANNIFFNTDVPVSVDPEVVMDLDDIGELVQLRGLTNLTVESVLNILVGQVGDELAWTVRNGRVYITSAEKALGVPMPKIHNIQDLTFPLTDFKGADLREIPLPGEAGDDNETTVFSSELERINLIEPDEIENLIRENIGRETWDLSDAYSIGFVDSNNLLVVHTPEIQRQVVDFLNALRAFSTSMVTLEARFIAITDAFIEEIGSDLRGLGPSGNSGTETELDDVDEGAGEGQSNSGDGGDDAAGILYDDPDDFMVAAQSELFFGNPLGDLLNTVGGGAFQFTILDDTQINIVMRAVEKSVNAFEMTAPIVSVYNTQRAFVTVVNQKTFIQGFDVNVANAASIADPVIGVIQEGIVLDVRPTISFDRKYITLDVQTTIADLVEPMKTFSTSLASTTSASDVVFDLPELDVQDARTTVVVPDGGSVVIGGFKNITYRNRTAESPWLAQIPILGFFFQEKGLADEMEDLIIVITAQITDFSDLQNHPVSRR
ncbi:MAG: hypothetical protein VX916_06830 [Planctomycetota bacterium]|nr:hypothetical protein [Planctomycetota bacterium]